MISALTGDLLLGGTGITPKPKLVEVRAKSLYEVSLEHQEV